VQVGNRWRDRHTSCAGLARRRVTQVCGEPRGAGNPMMEVGPVGEILRVDVKRREDSLRSG